MVKYPNMGKVFYYFVYLIVYSLILLGETVRKSIVWLIKTIGYIPRKIYASKLKFPRISSLKWFLLGSFFTVVFIFIPFILFTWFQQLPNPLSLGNMRFPATTKFYDRNNKLLYELFAEIDRQPIQLGQIPQTIIDATIAVEDAEFYHHLGFSPRGIARAFRETFLNHDIQGGSTITQQLIKNTLLTPEPTFRRKAKEVVLAFWAEQIYSKDEIMEMYLNNVPYGGTAWGISAASRKYFGKPVQELSLGESALLTGLPAAPTTYSPYGAHPELVKKRQAFVLSRMQNLGFITKQEEEEAKKEEVVFKPQLHNIKAPHFVMYTKQKLEKTFGTRIIEQGGLHITTSLDLQLQEIVQAIVKEEIAKLSNLNVGNAAVLVTNPSNGQILAMVGSVDYFDTEGDGNVNIATTLQQPGSSIKVVNYAAALQTGITAATIINDAPITFTQANGKTYSPVNYDGRFHGPVPLRQALASSYNIPAVKVLKKIGVEAMVKQGQDMGINSWDDPARFGLSLTLGGGEVTMIDMAQVYGTLANSGKKVNLQPVLEIIDFKEDILQIDQEPINKDVLPEEIAFIITDILSDNAARTPAFGANSLLNIPDKYIAVKTGTSNNKRDNWTIGYTKDYAVVVWVGNNDNSPMHPTLTSGVTGAAPIWRRIFDHLLEGREVPPPQMPEGAVKIPCYGRYEYFTKETLPKNGCGIWPKQTSQPLPTP